MNDEHTRLASAIGRAEDAYESAIQRGSRYAVIDVDSLGELLLAAHWRADLPPFVRDVADETTTLLDGDESTNPLRTRRERLIRGVAQLLADGGACRAS